jgi:uncharacterized membrane protein HdeD (DUF308 family)
MTDRDDRSATPAELPIEEKPLEPSAQPPGQPWRLLLAAGIVAFGLGVTLAAWPRESVAVVAFLLAMQLLATGIAGLASALVPANAGTRWVHALTGAVSVVVGLLLMVHPLQTLTFVGWAGGLCVCVIGATDLLGAFMGRGGSHRVWRGVRGLLGLAAGAFLLANPDRSIELIVVVVYVWLIGFGFITIAGSLLLRSAERRDHHAAPAHAAGNAHPLA